jgi:hypothetical protein
MENTNPKTWYNLAIFYALISLVLVALPHDMKFNSMKFTAKEKDAFAILVPMAVFIVHAWLLYGRKTLLPYGKAFMNIVVIDWGPFGSKGFELPEHLCTPFPHWVACGPDMVSQTALYVEQGLKLAKNERYLDPPIESLRIVVKKVYFRTGERCNESPEEYIKFVTEMLEAERLAFFKVIDEGKDIDPEWLEKNYLQPGYNGSRLS